MLEAAPGAHILCNSVASHHVNLLNLVGQHERARALGSGAIKQFESLQFHSSDYIELTCFTAEALAFCGEHLLAIDMVNASIAELEQASISGVRLGAACESRARVAIAMKDTSDFERWSLRCGEIYTKYDSPTLSAKHGRLLQQARARGLRAADSSPHPDYISTASDENELTDHSRMGECIDARERAVCALTLLLEHSDSEGGHLYGVVNGQLTHLAAVPDRAPPAELPRTIARLIHTELEACEATAATALTDVGLLDQTSRSPVALCDGLRPIILSAQRDGQTVIAAVAAVARKTALQNLSAPLLSSLAEILLDHGDVSPLTESQE